MFLYYNMYMDNSTQYTLQEASQKLNIKSHTLRHLCNSGLIPGIRRNKSNRRVLTESQLDQARIMLGLRNAGLKKSELKRYASLVRQGDETLPERKAILETEKRQTWQRLEDIQRDIDFFERQIELIDQHLSARTNN